jgi:hypothetical protein
MDWDRNRISGNRNAAYIALTIMWRWTGQKPLSGDLYHAFLPAFRHVSAYFPRTI